MVPTWKLHLNPNKSSKIATNPSTPKVNVKGTREYDDLMKPWYIEFLNFPLECLEFMGPISGTI